MSLNPVQSSEGMILCHTISRHYMRQCGQGGLIVRESEDLSLMISSMLQITGDN